jgi:two-component sensor histidine kinase
VQSIIRLTRAGSVAEYTDAIEGRIRALSRAHTVLSLSRWQGADLSGLIEEELAPYRTTDNSRIVTSGPNVVLQPAMAQSLALAIHELVTNAAKYGALSSIAGRVELNWALASDVLVLQWSESGGPLTRAPSAPGFGTRIIKASIEGQLSGSATFDWRPAGLRCTLSVPRGETMCFAAELAQPVPGPDAGVPQDKVALTGQRIMVVEDEALVAMALRDALDDMGYAVVGPFGKISEALVALKYNDVDAAILDVNLGSELVYPLADVLAAEGVPFVFVTGYGAEAIDRRFSSAPVLQKPIESHALSALFAGDRGVSAVHASIGLKAVAT